MYLPVERIVDHHTNVFYFLHHFKLLVANFQLQIFIMTIVNRLWLVRKRIVVKRRGYCSQFLTSCDYEPVVSALFDLILVLRHLKYLAKLVEVLDLLMIG